jgi:hypothetical protein
MAPRALSSRTSALSQTTARSPTSRALACDATSTGAVARPPPPYQWPQAPAFPSRPTRLSTTKDQYPSTCRRPPPPLLQMAPVTGSSSRRSALPSQVAPPRGICRPRTRPRSHLKSPLASTCSALSSSLSTTLDRLPRSTSRALRSKSLVAVPASPRLSSRSPDTSRAPTQATLRTSTATSSPIPSRDLPSLPTKLRLGALAVMTMDFRSRSCHSSLLL